MYLKSVERGRETGGEGEGGPVLAGTRQVCVPLCSGFGARARVGAKRGIRDVPIHPSLEYAVRVACSWCAPPAKCTAVVTVSVLPL